MNGDRHPLAFVQELRQHHLNRNATTEELIATLDMAQMETEKLWGEVPGEVSRCNFSGCNYRRYPASRFCMYHVTGHDTFAARLRSSINRDKRKGVDVSEFDGILQRITENIAPRR